ncbi:hypothetical protein Avbf_15063 [Armadillidium vulgare]|nr:hypothetical protein Avbf_15063 [Armadillidium vulgare]
MRRELYGNGDPDNKDFLQDHPIINSSKMRQHSIKVFRLFKTLLNEENHWVDKHVIQAEHALSNFYDNRGKRERIINKSPLVHFFEGESDTLNCSLLPDGLHVNTRFMEAFMRSNRNIFYQISGHNRYGEPVAKRGKTIHSRMLVHSRQLPVSSDDDDDDVINLPRENQENDSGTFGLSDNVDRCLRRFVDFREPSTSSTYEEYYPTSTASTVPPPSHDQPQQETTWGDAHKFYTYTLPDYDYGKVLFLVLDSVLLDIKRHTFCN